MEALVTPRTPIFKNPLDCDLIETINPLDPTKATYYCPVCERTDLHLSLNEIEHLTGVRQMSRNCSVKLQARAQKRTQPCIYRGYELRRERCLTCTGNVLIKVFACDFYGECTVEKSAGIRICSYCETYHSANTCDTLS